MNKIEKYLAFVFSDYEASPRVKELKEEIQANLIEKRDDAMSLGMSEEEATLKAIASLGNIEDVMKEIGVELASEAQSIDMTSFEHLHRLRQSATRKGGFLVAIGVFLCIQGVGLQGFSVIEENEVFSLLALFIPIAIGVLLFIMAGVLYFKQDNDYSTFILDHHKTNDFKYWVNQQKQIDQKRMIYGGIGIFIGILLVLSGVIVSTVSNYHTLFFFLIGLGVMSFIISGVGFFALTTKAMMESSIEKTCETEREKNKVMNVVDGIVFPLLGISFVAIGLLIDARWWSIGWIVFPIYAIVSNGIRGLLTLKESSK